ncbi:hypothetical protein PHYSODRAFT_327283 [Phytophthora sojae]|uniref:Uncharacterized protein n=1 Tax=Phytophthora sojae (strain P6497) TaxID=1094619 RepID=G4Z0R1_PHYSP|nr:hypothetical protein PHYSODRAFT_327283 [Phytophthora sojae]EGZ26367.1 hypothetical protein PHYSODRAFT_327283 [Phytophthora sojae]|eukprot:XP_009521655.1 hypothetical protein PHYSODRAFT_327283 [Phytophthora sojae]
MCWKPKSSETGPSSTQQRHVQLQAAGLPTLASACLPAGGQQPAGAAFAARVAATPRRSMCTNIHRGVGGSPMDGHAALWLGPMWPNLPEGERRRSSARAGGLHCTAQPRLDFKRLQHMRLAPRRLDSAGLERFSDGLRSALVHLFSLIRMPATHGLVEGGQRPTALRLPVQWLRSAVDGQHAILASPSSVPPRRPASTVRILSIRFNWASRATVDVVVSPHRCLSSSPDELRRHAGHVRAGVLSPASAGQTQI